MPAMEFPLKTVLHPVGLVQVNGAGTLDPATHAYAFWEGIPVKARVAFGELFANSSTLQSVAIVQRAIRRQTPAELMAGYNFGSLQLMDTLKGIHMSGVILSTPVCSSPAACLHRPLTKLLLFVRLVNRCVDSA